jgi:phage I-like protein
MPQLLPAVYAVEGGRRCLRALYPLISADAATTEIHVAMEGSWEGHPSGPFSFDAQTFTQIVANFEANPNPVPLDYEHATEFALPAPACGWVQQLEVRHDESGANLYALVELTDEAASFIRAGKYRFSSGVFDFDSIDPQTGKSVGCEMTSLALTNLPFLRGQRPIKLSRRTAPTGARMSAVNKADLISHLRKLNAEEITPEMAQQLATALGMLGQVMGGGVGETEAEPMAAKGEPEEAAAPSSEPEKDEDKKRPMSVGVATASPMATPTALEAAPVAAAEAPPEAAPAADPMAALQSFLAEYGLTPEALMELLGGMGGAAEMPPAAPAPLSAKLRDAETLLTAREHAIAVLTKRATEAETALLSYRQKEADREVEALVDSGRCLDSGRAFARNLFLSDRAAFDQYVESLPAIVPVGSHASGHTPPTQDSPAINEEDPHVRSLRRMLSQTKLSQAAQDEAVARSVAQRKQQSNGGQSRV